MVQLNDRHTILIVDDDQSYRSILQAVFSDGSSYSVSTAEDGRDALQRLQTNPVDLVITDLQMPNLDGVSLIQEVKRRYPSTLFIVMSAFADEERYHSFLSNQPIRCLPKPFRRSEVLDLAKELLHQPSMNG